MAAARQSARKPRSAELAGAAAFRTELRRFLHATESVTSREGLTPERYDLLLMIEAASAANQPATVTSLCEMLDLRQQAVTELVKRAAEAGMIVRERSSGDGRVYNLRLTHDAEKRLLRVFLALRNDRAAFALAFDRVDLRFRASHTGRDRS